MVPSSCLLANFEKGQVAELCAAQFFFYLLKIFDFPMEICQKEGQPIFMFHLPLRICQPRLEHGKMCFEYLGRVECYVSLRFLWIKIFWRYLHPEVGDCAKSCFEDFWRAGSDWPPVQNFNLHSPPFMFFVHKYHIFDKYLTKMFPPGSLGSFSHDPNKFIRLRSKLSKIQAFTFCNFRNP